MIKLLRSLLALVVAIIVSFGHSHPAQAATANPSDVAALKQSVAAWEKAWSSGNELFSMDRVDDLYTHDDRFLEFDNLAETRTISPSYESFKSLWEPIMQESTDIQVIADDNVKVITDGKLGLTTFTLKTQFVDRKTKKAAVDHTHASLVWEKQGNRWVILHEHVSGPVKE
jgi:ketosteroid isomerase-like protein